LLVAASGWFVSLREISSQSAQQFPSSLSVIREQLF